MAKKQESLEATCASEVCAYRGTGACSYKSGEYCPMYVECKSAGNKEEKDPKSPEERIATPKPKAPKTEQKQEKGTTKLTRDKVTVFATLDEEMKKAINAAANANGHILVRLEEKVIDDFLAAKNAPTPEQTEVKSVEDFINDDNNRAKAESDAKKLYSFLTKDPIEEYAGKRFNRKDILKKTNLSNKGALAELTMLEAFGFVRYTGGKLEEFEFEFKADQIHRTVRRQALAMMTEAAKDFVRYKALLEQDTSLTKEQRRAEVSSLKAEIRRLLA